MIKEGKIIKQISNLYTVISENKLYECRARGKFLYDKLTPLVGEFVIFDSENGYILELKKRKNCLLRPTIANVDSALIITSVKKPDLSLNLLDKELAVIIHAGIEPIICFTKLDLLSRNEKKQIKSIIKYYKSIGIKVTTNRNLWMLKKYIKGKTIVLTGQTGAGKSSLLNILDKTLNLNTNEISESLGRGVHTTRHTELFKVGNALIADTPGFSSLDLNMSKEDLKNTFPEFSLVKCKFDNCMHVNEKNCKVKELVNNGKIKKERYENYVKFWGEL